MVERLRQIQESYEYIKEMVDVMYNILLGVMICYTVVIAVLCVSLPINVFCLRWYRRLPRVETVGFFVIGLLVSASCPPPTALSTPSTAKRGAGGGWGQGCVPKGGEPPSWAPSLRPATVSLTPSACFNGTCNRQ